MTSTRKTFATATMLIAAILITSAPIAADGPPWQEAAKVYHNAMSAYRRRQYAQAKPSLEKFIRFYGSHESAPGAYLQLAQCKAALGDEEGAAEEIEKVIRLFRLSPQWFQAYKTKLGKLWAAKEYDEYWKEYESFVRQIRVLPLYYHGYRPASWYSVPMSDRSLPGHLRWLRAAFTEDGWERELLQIADTPERAQKVLGLMERTLRTVGEDLPANWQMTHILLLEKSGDPNQAERQFRAYATKWEDDPRGLDLHLRWARHQRTRGTEPADRAYTEIIEKYMGYSSLSVALSTRLADLRKENRDRELKALGEMYLETYPMGPLRGTILSYRMERLRERADAGEEGAFDELKQFLYDRYGTEENSGYTRDYLIDYYVAHKEGEKAAELGRWYVRSENWSAESYSTLNSYAGQSKAFAPLVEEAKKTYGIYGPADPNSEPAKMLADLQERTKANQVRFMEAIGDDLYEKHRKTDQAVTAVFLLGNYYYQKVDHEMRDKWMARMFEAYPRHPKTQRLLSTYIMAMMSLKEYMRAGTALDWFKERFPTGVVRNHRNHAVDWDNLRMRVYQAINDEAGVKRLRDKHHAELVRQANAGNVNAMEQLMSADESLSMEKAPTKKRGQYWENWAKKFAGSRIEIYCLRQAQYAYYNEPLGRDGRKYEKEVLVDDAVRVLRKLQTQQVDPEVRWNVAFEDINILFSRGKLKEALELFNEKLPVQGRTKIRDLSMRLSFGTIAGALSGEKTTAKKALELADRLERICFTERDRLALNGMRAHVYTRVGAHGTAQKYHWNNVEAAPWPIAALGYYNNAFDSARRTGPDAIKSVCDRYVGMISGCQDTVPKLLYQAGHELLQARSAKFKSIHSKLSGQYPASSWRGRLEAEYAKARK